MCIRFRPHSLGFLAGSGVGGLEARSVLEILVSKHHKSGGHTPSPAKMLGASITYVLESLTGGRKVFYATLFVVVIYHSLLS